MANEPSGDIVEDMLPLVASAESSGNPDASNPNSSATGLLQFTDPTWNRLLQNYPNQGLTAEGKNDPEQQKQAFRLLAKNEYIPALTKMGQSVSAPNIYAMHVLGQPSATALMQASPDTPASKAVGDDNWRDIRQNNPSLFGEDGNITSGQALAAVGSHLIGATGQEPAPSGPDGDINDGRNIFMSQGLDQADDTGGNAAVPTPTLSPHIVDPNANLSPLARFFRWAASMGSGADAKTDGGALGTGGAAALQDILNRQQQTIGIQQANDQIDQQNYGRQMQAADLQARNAQVGAMRGRAAAQLVAAGMSPLAAVALMSGRSLPPGAMTGGANGMRPGGKIGTQQYLEAPDPNGGAPHRIMVSAYKNGTGALIQDLTTGKQLNALPAGAYDPKTANVAGAAKADQTALDADRESTAKMSTTAQQGNALIADLPHIPAGPGIGAKVSRAILNATGVNSSSLGDADALQRANMWGTNLRTAALSNYRGLGRLDLPEIQNAYKSVPAIDATNPSGLYYWIKEYGNQAKYKQDMQDAWTAKNGNADTAQGYKNFVENYTKAHKYEPLNYDDMKQVDPQLRALLGIKSAPAQTIQGASQGPSQQLPAGLSGKSSTGVGWSLSP
ncbi:transglycosylase SLT domain-containing protein [Acetobacter sp. UBA5411]|uniref:transglycosylase SLT domain-containing protein n=1 Tax=Acetobacter sp. UBA5411 TaxID=1945905 RepID=UPI0025BE9A55|nr:transglycosylase SLT domain-containing protein [Acetobacter sp. UBA5411]